MSPHEGDGDIVEERAKEVGGIKPGGDGQDDFGRGKQVRYQVFPRAM